AEHVAGFRGDDQCVRRIESAGYANDEVRAARGVEAPHEALHLDVESFVAVLVELRRPARHVRKAAQCAAQAHVAEMRMMLESDGAELRFGIAGGARAIVE